MTSDMVKLEKMSAPCQRVTFQSAGTYNCKEEKGMQNETKMSIQACVQLLIRKPILGILGYDLYFSILLSAMLDIWIIKPG